MTLREYINSLSDEGFIRFLFPKLYPRPCHLCNCRTVEGCAYDDLEVDIYEESPFDYICRKELFDSLRETVDLTTINSRK